MPWTNINPCGTQSVSQAAHVIGFAVGYQGLVSFEKTVSDSNMDRGWLGFDESLEPPPARPRPDGLWDGTELPATP